MREKVTKKGFKDYLRDPNMWFIACICFIGGIVSNILEPILFPECDGFLQEIIIGIGIMVPIVLVGALIWRAVRKGK